MRIILQLKIVIIKPLDHLDWQKILQQPKLKSLLNPVGFLYFPVNSAKHLKGVCYTLFLYFFLSFNSRMYFIAHCLATTLLEMRAPFHP